MFNRISAQCRHMRRYRAYELAVCIYNVAYILFYLLGCSIVVFHIGYSFTQVERPKLEAYYEKCKLCTIADILTFLNVDKSTLMLTRTSNCNLIINIRHMPHNV